MAKSSIEILQEMIDYLSTSTNFSDVDKSEGSVLRDVVLDSVARQLEIVYDEIDLSKTTLLFLENAASISVADMDSIAKNYGLTRLAANKASGKIIFRKKNLPDSPIVIGAVDGTGGIIVGTRQLEDGTTIQFITTETVTLQTDAVLNPASGYYEVEANIDAIIEGESGNISAGSITNLSSSISGIDTVYNTIPTTSGTEIEDNESLAERIILAIAGNNRVNRAGYESFIKNNFPAVIDVLAVDPNDSDALRGPGKIDAYIYGKNLKSYSENITFNLGTNDYLLTKKPVSSITSLVAKVLGVDTTLEEDVDYEFVKDETSVLAYSIQSGDKIRFKDLGKKPDNATQFSIIYSYDKLIEDIQSFYELEENKILGIDVLIKETQTVNLDIAFDIRLYSGNSLRIEELKNKVITVLTNYLQELGLKASVSQSDIVFKIREAVEEVDDISLPFTTFKVRGEAANSDLITLESKQYIEIDGSTFTITVL